MHDETFLVTQGKMRFHLLNGKIIDAAQGDYVTVPTRSPHVSRIGVPMTSHLKPLSSLRIADQHHFEDVQ